MNVLVDTSVWSLALRRAPLADAQASKELTELIREGRVTMLGAVRQELLSGVRGKAQFRRLRDHLRSFPDVAMESADYEEAATAFNRCRERGIQGSNTDFLICAVAQRRRLAIYTTDGDFRHFARVLRIALHEPRS